MATRLPWLQRPGLWALFAWVCIQAHDKALQLLRIGGSCPFSQGPSCLYSLLLCTRLLSDFPAIGSHDALAALQRCSLVLGCRRSVPTENPWIIFIFRTPEMWLWCLWLTPDCYRCHVSSLGMNPSGVSSLHGDRFGTGCDLEHYRQLQGKLFVV